MGLKTKIEWAESSWNPVDGCSKVSAGCKNCYAERMSKQFGRTFRVRCHENRLSVPAGWKTARRVFVCSMGDLFHDDVPYWFIMRIFRRMAAAPQHTYVVLTKRSKRMANVTIMASGLDHLSMIQGSKIWFGVTIENQESSVRAHDLSRLPGRFPRFISFEPLLENVELSRHIWPTLDWVIVGGETGAGARPMKREWAIAIRDKCLEFNVPFFFKQWGEFNEAGERVGRTKAGRFLDGKMHDEYPKMAPEATA